MIGRIVHALTPSHIKADCFPSLVLLVQDAIDSLTCSTVKCILNDFLESARV